MATRSSSKLPGGFVGFHTVPLACLERQPGNPGEPRAQQPVQNHGCDEAWTNCFFGSTSVPNARTISQLKGIPTKAKHTCERFCGKYGVWVKDYHADIGCFADNAFIGVVFAQGQEITYCGVNAHFQNGVAEKRIRDLQDLTRTSLLHAAARWPKAILVHLWPYAL